MDNLFAKALDQEVADLQAVGYPHSNACAAVSAARVGLMIFELGEMLEVLPKGQQAVFQPKIKATFEYALLVGVHALMDNRLESLSNSEIRAEGDRCSTIMSEMCQKLEAALTATGIFAAAEGMEAPLQ